MKLRTGHGPNDWSDNIPGARGRVSGFEPKSSGFSVGGAMPDGESGKERARRLGRESAKRAKAAQE